MLRESFLAIALTAPSAAQSLTPRPSTRVDINSTGNGNAPSVATAGDLTAVAFTDTGRDAIEVVTSDGRGVTWSSPRRVDQDPGNALKLTKSDSCVVTGDRIYALWSDARNGTQARQLYLNFSADRGLTWAGEQRIDNGFPSNSSSVFGQDWNLAASGLDVYVLMSVAPTGAADQQLWLARSHDGGATFASPLRVDAPAGASDVDDCWMSLEGNLVHIAWLDERNNPGSNRHDVYYRRFDAMTQTFGAEIALDSSGPLVGDADLEIQVSSEGPVVAVAWLEDFQPSSPSIHSVQVAVSIDSGATFSASRRVGGYTANVDDVDFLAATIENATIYLAWSDRRTGSDRVWITSSADLGTSWRADVAASTTGGTQPHFAGAGTDLVLAFPDAAAGDDATKVAHTTDGGASWRTDQTISDTTGDADFGHLAFNPLYRNAIVAWLSNDAGSNNVYVGGFRPQTCTVNGIRAGLTPMSFSFHSFSQGATLGWALLAAAPGPLPLFVIGDERDLGLSPDALFNLSGSVPAFFSVPLAGGAGTTTPFFTALRSGLTLVYAGVEFTPTRGFGDLGDVLRITVP